MCAEAKHSVERSPWHCCKNKRIANGAYPPRPRRLRFIYDTSEPNPTLLLFLHLLGDLAPGLLLKDKEESQPEEIGLNSSLKFLSPAHISFLYFIFPSPSLSSPSSFLLLLFLFLSLSRRKNCEGRVVKKKIVISSGTILLRGILERLLKKQFLLPSCFMVP